MWRLATISRRCFIRGYVVCFGPPIISENGYFRISGECQGRLSCVILHGLRQFAVNEIYVGVRVASIR
jgi:hypothetical protein